MKTLVISDTHLDTTFDEKKYAFLRSIIGRADRVIINGDFWEGISISFDDFITSAWNALFPLLKQKKTIYLYGNHDRQKYADKRVSLFSVSQGDSYILKEKNTSYYIQHGHQFKTSLDSFSVLKLLRPYGAQIHAIEGLVMRTIGTGIPYRFYKRLNEQIKNQKNNTIPQHSILVCGHTHAVDFDMKNNYINAGFIKYGLGQYLTIEDGRATLHGDWYDKPSLSLNFHLSLPEHQLAYSVSRDASI